MLDRRSLHIRTELYPGRHPVSLDLGLRLRRYDLHSIVTIQQSLLAFLFYRDNNVQMRKPENEILKCSRIYEAYP